MPNLLSAAVEYGGYISLIKLIGIAAMFFIWMPLVNWIHTDAQEVRTNVRSWTGGITATGAGALIIWLLLPFYFIGLLLCLIAVGATALAYVIHRNSRVSDFEKILTVDHIKNLFVDEDKKIAAASKGLSFITANNNKAPMPAPKTPESFGFKTACEIFEDAIWRRASDVIFQPAKQGYAVIYRIDGLAVKQQSRSREEIEYFTNYIKQLADLDMTEKRKPQTGIFKVVKDSRNIDWKVTTAGSTMGEQVKFQKREEYSLMKIDDLGLNPDQVDSIKAIREIGSGLFIISGPKKSGVTSTMYAMLRNHDPFLNNINTLEKQTSGELDNITQHTFTLSDSSTITYAKKLQTILRMGPDIMGIADCEDAQSASLACAAAKDGKIVYVIIEAASAMQALAKWIKLVSDKELAAKTLAGISNQRIARMLCKECRQAYHPNENLLKKFNIPSDKIKAFYRPGEIEYDKHGKPLLCENCQGTGFFGRTGVFETFTTNEKSREAVKQAKTLQEIANAFRRGGMLYMQEQSIKKVAAGITSINEIIREFSSGQNTQKKPVKTKKK